MNKRLAISIAAFVGWLLSTVVGGQMHTGEAPLLEAASRSAMAEADRLHLADMAVQVGRLQKIGKP